MRLHSACLLFTAMFAFSWADKKGDDSMGTVIGIDLGTTYSW